MGGDPVNAAAATSQLDTEALSRARVDDARASVDPLIGREVIGQYRIEKKIGSGGMGTVYLAEQTTVQRPAVIKVLRPQQGGKLDLPARFAIEARAASNLNHPNIVTVYNYGQMDDGTLFLAMEYLDGETLESRIARTGPLPVDRAVHVASQIARALGEAHAHGVVHRDLKPANIMLVARDGDSDFVKVLDFGIAKLDDAAVTSAGYVVGTPRYMSPEQLLGQQLDRRSDIYSAGIVLYEMLAGVTPFSSDTPIGWVRQHVDAVPKPPSAAAKGLKIPVAVERVVMRTIAKKPDDRPPSMEMLALDLVAALNAPTEPPRWRRVLAASAHFLVAFATIFGSRTATITRSVSSAARRFMRLVGSAAWRFARAVGSGTWRFAGAVGSGTRRFAGAVGSGTRRFARAVGSGMRRFARAVGSGMRRFARAVGFGVWRAVRSTTAGISRLVRAVGRGAGRALRALGSGLRRYVLSPPARAAKWLVATKRRRWIAITAVVVGSAGAVLAEVPALRQSLFGKATVDVADTPKPKTNKPKHTPSSRVPVRDKTR